MWAAGSNFGTAPFPGAVGLPHSDIPEGSECDSPSPRNKVFTGRGDQITGRSVGTFTLLSPDPVRIPGATSHFYQLQPMRPLDEITADIMASGRSTEGLLAEIVGIGTGS